MVATAKERVLVVDDEPQVLVALEDLLSSRFTVVATASAHHALDLLRRERDVAVVVSDQRMPQMSGDELLRELARSHDALRILLTGFADLSAVIRAVNDGGIFAYVTKPWDPQDLALKVEKAVEQFRLTRELAHERQLLRDLMDNTPDGIYFKDRELRFRRANGSLSAMLGQRAPEALVGRRLRDLSPDSHVGAVEEEEQAIISGSAAGANTVRQYRRGDTCVWLSETKAPIRNARGDIVGLVGILRDVTQQRVLEEQLRQSQKMEAIGRMAGGIAHDFNNLLVVIQSYGELLLEELPDGDPKREDLKHMLLAGDRAASLTRQLLAFSRRQALQTKVLDLNEVVSNVVGLLRRVIGETIELDTLLDPRLGAMRGDPAQLEQIVLNLAINSRDAMPGGGKLTIETVNFVATEKHVLSHPGTRPGEYVVLRVIDTGTGMDPDTLHRMFDPFFTTKEVGKGTGLGLSTVYGIVQQNQGHIFVDSAVNQGTSFEIWFPRADRAEPDAVLRRTSSLPPTGSETILLVEDDEPVRQVAARILRNQGYRVLEASGPAQALQICAGRDRTIDLLLTDVVMPEITGPELVDELSRNHPQLRVLYMSGYPGSGVADRAMFDGADGFVEKPFTPAALLDKVRAALRDPVEPK